MEDRFVRWGIEEGCPDSACSESASPPSVTWIELPTWGPQVDGGGCAFSDLSAWAFAGNPADPAVAWLQQGNERLDVKWPEGYLAAFDPDLRVVDRHGLPVVRAGDHVSGACVVGDEHYLTACSFE